jgi:hypothetical protein
VLERAMGHVIYDTGAYGTFLDILILKKYGYDKKHFYI